MDKYKVIFEVEDLTHIVTYENWDRSYYKRVWSKALNKQISIKLIKNSKVPDKLPIWLEPLKKFKIA